MPLIQNVLCFLFALFTLIGFDPSRANGQDAAVLAVIGSALAWLGGLGLRAYFYSGQYRTGLMIGTTFLLLGELVLYRWGGPISLFRVAFPNAAWGLLGFAVGFLVADRRDSKPISSASSQSGALDRDGEG